MAKKWQKVAMTVTSIVMASSMALGMTACGGGEKPIPDANLKEGTYRTTTAVMPSNWNEFTYADNNDTQIMSYIGSSFFDYDYEFDEAKGGKYNDDGTINAAAIVPGSYTTNYSAATKLEDVTSSVDAKWGYTADQKAEGGYAWKITLRDDLKWDDGTEIHAADFEYSMKEQLNPDFLNFRANTYYDTLRIKKSRSYFFQNQEATYPTVGSQGYETNAAAIAAGETIYIDAFEFYNAQGYVDAEGNEIEQWVAFDDETVYDTPDAWAAGEEEDAFSGKDLWDYFFAPDAPYGYGPYVEVGASYESWLSIKVVNQETDVDWSEVGMYVVDENSFVVCLDKSYQFLKEDGSLSYLAAYYMSSLPLVKQDLYESCKKAPAEGSTLWTSNYNSTLATTASWGPYKLTEFQSGKSYKLERNEYWYGYSMNQYANQYNITAVECECVPESSTQWLKFLAGETDDASLDTEHVNDYMYSKYTTYAPDSGTFGMQLFSDLDVLKASDNNNGILAIDQFRQAFSLSLNRDNVVETIWPGTALACYGVMNDQYFYDVENGGVYRYTEQAKKGLLRAYGFTEGTDGKWSNGELSGLSLEDAYDAMTGYNPTLAKQLVIEAYNELTANAEKYGYDANKDITLVYGSSQDTARQRARADYLQGVLDTLTKDTGLEGKIKIVFDASAGSKWADAFRNGDTQIGFGYGFSGNPFNPFDMIGAFVDPDDSLNYHTYWDTTKVSMTLTMPAGDYEGAGQTITMSVKNWFDCLNGLATEKNDTYKYNWDAGIAPAEVRLEILAALEEQVLSKCYSIMLIAAYSGSLLSPKFSYISYDYNTFMGFGGMRYMLVNYTDAEWTDYVKANNNDLTSEYKKTSD
ncbi:MAG: ABC transporter substrate-binding protein [Candidatus Coproplasma sp.]